MLISSSPCRHLRLALALAPLALGGCATAPIDPNRLAPWAMPDLPRSSISAVVAKRQELALGQDQVEALLERDEALVHQEHALLGPGARPPPRRRPPSSDDDFMGGGGPGGGMGGPGGHGGGGAMGGGPGGMGPPGGMGAMGGGMGGPPGGMGGPGGGKAPERGLTAEAAAKLLDQLDAADTQAYLRAEEQVLRPEQREQARQVAGDYRAALHDRREAIRAGKVPAPPAGPPSGSPPGRPPGPQPGDAADRPPPPGAE